MPFRSRQKLENYSSGKIVYDVTNPNPDTGIVELKSVEQNGPSARLPDSDMMDLQALIKAGIPLEKVNCNLIAPDSSDVSTALQSFKKTSKDKSDTPSQTEDK